MATSTPALNPTSSSAPAQPGTAGTFAARSTRLTDDEIFGIVSEPADQSSAEQSVGAIPRARSSMTRR
jgi:hypothetical protein